MRGLEVLPACAAGIAVRAVLTGSALGAAAAGAADGMDAALSVPDRIRGAMLGALVGDALCLGSHYEYDAGVIRKAYGVSGEPADASFSYMAPGEKMGGTTHGVGWGRQNYHPGQKKGDQTDYGEYSMLALEYLAAREATGSTGIDRAIQISDFLPFWRRRLESDTWGAWRCTQTKQALQQVAHGVPPNQLGGMSNAMGLRSPAVFGVFQSEDAAAAASQTLMFTHRNPEALVGGEFFTRVAHKIIFQGLSPTEALEQTCQQMGSVNAFVQAQCDKGFKKYQEATDPSSPLAQQSADQVDDLAITSMARLWDVGKSEPIKVGKASPTEGTMPSSIYLILKYEKQGLAAAARANALVGGDNASRGVAIGMVLGAYYGAERGVPADLKLGLNHWEKAQELLGTLPLVRKGERGEEL